MNVHKIPAELRERKQWVCSELPTKRPVRPSVTGAIVGASVRDPDTWSTFDACAEAASKRNWGVAFVLGDDDPYAVIDLDHVRNAETGETEPWALKIIDELSSYSEVSLSGTGWHIVVRGKLPTSTGLHVGRVEIYDHAKAITLTGDVRLVEAGSSEIVERDLSKLYARVTTRKVGDAKAPSAPNGSGDQSRDDFVLALKLAREFGGDVAKTREAFLKQAPQRDKLKRDDYVNRTIEKAIASVLTSPAPQIVEEPKELVVADMPDSVLDGRLGEICQRRLSALPIAYSWGALVTCAGTLVPRLDDDSEESLLPRNHREIRTNLFWCPVGSQGSGKTQAVEQALSCLGMWPKHECLVKGKFGSVEGMLSHLEGVSGGNRLLFPDELGHLLAKANIERSGFPFVLNSAYYDDEFLVTMAKGKKVHFHCRLSLAGGVIEEMFGDLFGASTTGGLHGRFIFGLGPKPFTFLWRPYDTRPEKVNPIVVEADPEIWEARDEWVKNNPGSTSPRIAEHALRMAAICASFDGRKVLRAKDLGPAFEFARYQVRVRYVLEPNPGENPDARCAFAILAWLRANAAKGQAVARRTLYSAIHAQRLGPGVFDRALKNLAYNEELLFNRSGKRAVVALSAANIVAADGCTSSLNRG